MNETNKFVDECGDWIQAFINYDGLIQIATFGNPEPSPDQAIEFAKQLTELAKEAKAKQ